MAEAPNKILAMSDDDLQRWALSGGEGSYVHEIGQTAMNMRCSLRMARASEEMAGATRNLVKATWGIVVITFVIQVAPIVLSLMRKLP